MFRNRRVLDGDIENGSAPATYLPAAICASCVDQRMLGTVCPSLSVRVVGVIAPDRFSISCSACSAQKPRPDACVINNPIELRPIGGDLDHVVRIAEVGQIVRATGLRTVCRQSLVNADVEEPGVFLELVLVVYDHCVGRIGDRLVIEPPARERQPRRCARRERDVVAATL